MQIPRGDLFGQLWLRCTLRTLVLRRTGRAAGRIAVVRAAIAVAGGPAVVIASRAALATLTVTTRRTLTVVPETTRTTLAPFTVTTRRTVTIVAVATRTTLTTVAVAARSAIMVLSVGALALATVAVLAGRLVR